VHAIEPPSFGVQDASNQTDAPEDTDEQKQEPFVKQEQNLSPCQVAPSPGTNLTPANFEIVAPPTERICNVVRITTTTTTMNPTACGIVAKVDKAENTIINMADCAKFSAKDSRNIVRPIERDEEISKDEKIPACSRNNRIGARIIEITEENCDSFHENLEFFARRRDVSVDDHRDNYSKDEHNIVQESVQEKVEIESKTINTLENIENHRAVCSKAESPIFNQPKPSVADSTESSKVNCESCDKNRNASTNSEARPQITMKSFDPDIDCDHQEAQQVVIKQEADDSCYEVCYESLQCEPTSTSERPKPSCEKLSSEITKRHSTEKSHYSGIENVVEKLKKNAAAALQEASLPNSQKIEESTEGSNVENAKSRRQSETIPKKLHFLRSCQNSMENSIDTEVSSSQIAMTEQHAQEQSRSCSPRVEDLDEDRHSSTSSKCDTSGECLLSDNNNDSRSNNNNIKPGDEKVFAKNEKNVSYDVSAYVKPKTALRWRSEIQPGSNTHKYDSVEEAPSELKSRAQKQKIAIDVSGLELLSNSIEQLEQRIGQPEHPQLDMDAEKSSTISPQSENSNNVGSRLGLLCALAEQIIKVDNKASLKPNLENSEEISNAGKLLLDLGRGDYPNKDKNKRKHHESDRYSKRLKFDEPEVITNKNASLNYHEENIKDRTLETTERQQEETLLKENTKCRIDFSGEEISNIADKKVVDSKERDDEDDQNCYSNKCGMKTTGDIYVSSDETPDELQSYDNIAKENSLIDSEDELFIETRSSSEQAASYEIENKKRKISIEERDNHDYKNARTKSEAKKFLAKKGNRDNEDDWPNMNATELDMRVRMADIQRQYREKQKELSKLTPKKDDKKNIGRLRKKSHSSVR